ncbi:MAG: galactokinase [Planctomycetota bacterium]
MSEVITAYAPGRAEWLGNHTDYNEGFVLAVAVNLGVTVTGRARADGRLRVHAREVGETWEGAVEALWPAPGMPWANYVIGVLAGLRARRVAFGGAEMGISATLPMGAGLSSSAALELATLFFVKRLYPFDMEPLAMARLAQTAEHEFTGVRCGLLDQLASLLGRDGAGTYIDCRDHRVENIPVPPGHVFVIVHSGVRHNLVSDAYNERRASCEQAARVMGVKALRDVTPEALAAARSRLPPVAWKRAHHVVGENDRVLAAVRALRVGDAAAVGRLMVASHESSRDFFENSCPELDFLVEAACAAPGCRGARLSGGGFGGAIIAWVEADRAEEFQETVAGAYEKRYGNRPRSWVTPACEGAWNAMMNDE